MTARLLLVPVLLGVVTVGHAATIAGCNSQHQVRIDIGCFQGSANASTGVESFLGVPFAEPPLGPLRFKSPVPIRQPLPGIQDATKFGDACNQVIPPAFATTPGSIFATNNANSSENCLFMNVYRPTGTTQNDGLPVVVFIPGGGNRFGAGSSYDPTLFIRRSVTRGRPLMFVSFNYRLTTFGWLASSKVPQEDLNAGFSDQRQLLAFVNKNIAQFGGDPGKVTIMGQSYGGGAVELHMIFPPTGTSQLPFRAGIINSASGPFKNFPPVSAFEAETGDWTLLLKLTGCPNTDKALDCLRALSADALMNATNILATEVAGDVWPASMGGPLSTFPIRPSIKISQGDFVHLPIIGGTVINDGTLFTVTKTRGLAPPADEAEADAAFQSFVRNIQMDNTTMTPDVLARFNTLYPFDPNDTKAGLPFKTGDILYDRASQWWTETIFLGHRRAFVGNNSVHAPTFSYFWTQAVPNVPEFLGAYHGAELSFMFGLVPDPQFQPFINTYLDFYINFVHDLNPGNGWPQFNTLKPMLMQFQNNNVTVIPDDFSLEATNFVMTAEVQAQLQK